MLSHSKFTLIFQVKVLQACLSFFVHSMKITLKIVSQNIIQLSFLFVGFFSLLTPGFLHLRVISTYSILVNNLCAQFSDSKKKNSQCFLWKMFTISEGVSMCHSISQSFRHLLSYHILIIAACHYQQDLRDTDRSVFLLECSRTPMFQYLVSPI